MILGERMKQLRKRKYTQEELADVLHVHVNTINKWENEKRAPNSSRLNALAQALNTSADYLLGETDNPTRDHAVEGLSSVNTQKSTEDNKISSSYIKKEQTKEESTNNGMLVYISRDGERFEAPPTPEGTRFILQMRATSAPSLSALTTIEEAFPAAG